MPAQFCDDTRPYTFTVDGVCDFFFDWTHDGTSVPPNCDGPITSIRWNNRSTRTYYAHLPDTRKGPYTQTIPPGSNGTESRKSTLTAAGLETLSDLQGVVINTSASG